MGVVREARIWASVPSRQMLCAGTWGSANVSVLVNLESLLLCEPRHFAAV